MIDCERICQGTVFLDDVGWLVSLSVDRKPEISRTEPYMAIAVSQDCDIQSGPDKEPYVEFIIGKETQKVERNFDDGKNPRRLNVFFEGKTYEISVHDRFRVKKDDLQKVSGITDFSNLAEDSVSILKRWLGKRYVRDAFPDEFNNRLSSAKVGRKIARIPVSEYISQIYIGRVETELDANEEYKPKIMAVVRDPIIMDDEELVEMIETEYEKCFSCPGIDPEVSVRSEDEVTLYDLRTYKRWDMDSYSLSGEEAPPDSII